MAEEPTVTVYPKYVYAAVFRYGTETRVFAVYSTEREAVDVARRLSATENVSDAAWSAVQRWTLDRAECATVWESGQDPPAVPYKPTPG